MRGQSIKRYAITMDANDLFIPLGFAPELVKLTYLATGDELYWNRLTGNDSSTTITQATTDKNGVVSTSAGIKLVKFEDPNDMSKQTADPTAVDVNEWYDANGIQITADVTWLADDVIILVEAWPVECPVIRVVHDGGDNSNTFVEDATYDLAKAGVGHGWLAYNQTNGDYAYVDRVEAPAAHPGIKCRAYLCTNPVTQAATAAADIDDDDVVFFFPPDCKQYPMSDIGAMT